MRPKFVFALLLLALLVLGAALYLKQHLGDVTPAAPEIASSPAPVSSVVTNLPSPPEPVPAAPMATNSAVMPKSSFRRPMTSKPPVPV